MENKKNTLSYELLVLASCLLDTKKDNVTYIEEFNTILKEGYIDLEVFQEYDNSTNTLKVLMKEKDNVYLTLEIFNFLSEDKIKHYISVKDENNYNLFYIILSYYIHAVVKNKEYDKCIKLERLSKFIYDSLYIDIVVLKEELSNSYNFCTEALRNLSLNIKLPKGIEYTYDLLRLVNQDSYTTYYHNRY